MNDKAILKRFGVDFSEKQFLAMLKEARQDERTKQRKEFKTLMQLDKVCPLCTTRRTVKINEFARGCPKCRKTYILEHKLKEAV